MTEGRLVTVEGIGGSGKSTLVGSLAVWLQTRVPDLVLTKEPGGTPVGSELRSRLLGGQIEDALAQAFLFEADRAMTYSEVILPALDRGNFVLSDRGAFGTVAYQAFGGGCDQDLVERMNAAATRGRNPDLAIVVDVPAEVGQARRLGTTHLDHFDAKQIDFQRRAREGYLAAAGNAPYARVLDGSLTPQAVLAAAQALIEPLLLDEMA